MLLVTHRPVPAKAFVKHAHQHRTVTVHIVVDADLSFARIGAVKPASVLDQGALPRDGHGQEERIEPGIVEALADVATGRQQDAPRILWYGGYLLCHGATLSDSHTSAQHNYVIVSLLQPAGKELQVLPSLRQQNR